MAIVKMNKFTLFTLQSNKEELLRNIQKFEGVQFVDLQDVVDSEEMDFLNRDSESKKVSEFEADLSKVKFCINLLDDYVEKEKGLSALKKGKKALSFDKLNAQAESINWISTYEALKEKEDLLTSLKNETTKIKSEIESLMSWVNFDAKLEEVENFRFYKCQLGTMPLVNIDTFKEEFSSKVPYSYVEVISDGRADVNVLVLYHTESSSQAEDVIKNNSFSKVNLKYEDTPKKVIENFEKRLKEIENEEKEISKQIKGFGEKLEELHIEHEYFSNKINEAKVCDNFLKTEKIVALEGWVTDEDSPQLEQIVKNVCGDYYYIEFKEADEEENIPVKLKNNGFVEPFESVVEMYSLPNYKEVDPTPIMSFFYIIFFGMMLSDAAYGALMVIGTTIALKAFKLDKSMKNSMKLFLYLGLSTFVWGIMYGSVFGDAAESLFGLKIGYLQNPFINPQIQMMDIMALSIVFGLIHIYVGLIMKAIVLIKQKKYMDILYDVVTWGVSVAGVLLLLGAEQIGLSAGAANVGKYMMIAGFIGLVLTQGRDAESLGGKIGGGIYGLYNITGYVGDIVSYTRLMALGLATGFISNAFNMMLGMFPVYIKFTLGLVLFVGLHLFNLGINALGAYVHTSRLQYLEFFGKFYEGGGKKFSPMKSESKYINITNE
jgi:V/A-type H+-transporting ATPase subunit I